jgi:chemotaxis protein MotA
MALAGLFDVTALLIVIGGALLVALMRSTREDIGGALRALGPLFAASPARDGEAARQAVGRVARLAEVRSLACADRVETAHAFLRTATRRLSDAATPAAFAIWAEEDIAARAARHAAAQGLWRTMADAAPAMGLVATILGLIRMFANMDDPARIGPAMAMALTATLYGVLLANLVAGPVAARLERLSEAELAWQRRAIAALVRLAEAEMVVVPAATAPAYRNAA